MRAVAEDIGVDAVKIGMLGYGRDDRGGRARRSSSSGDAPVVLDPVMVAESGAVLLDEDARARTARAAVLPRATVVHAEPRPRRECSRARRRTRRRRSWRARVHALGPGAVVVTGGHREEAADVFFDGGELVEIAGERHPDGAAHGSGLHALVGARRRLAHGLEPARGGAQAREIASEAVRDGLRGIGAGPGRSTSAWDRLSRARALP